MDEQYIIKQVLAGDQQAYGQIMDRYKNPLYATILRMTRNPQLAQDLVQEAFIKVYEQLGRYEETGSFKSWLYRIAINHCLDELRKKQYKIVNEELEEGQLIEEEHPEVIFLKKERGRQLEELLAKLPEQERLILLLRYSNELSYEEISELLHISLSDVRNKLHRSKKKMREQVQKGGDYYELSERR
ncbi:RNA polymerase sigma factor [Metasolibacillus meyeri]|uniref:RNA polymerase sigma factor n=1 Tax=Metasolibacillus meyeri TaxID=1071052 RepID=UPI000D3169FE|nr:RNA polymerase sigma factor [Metasolibacillus meyeri]